MKKSIVVLAVLDSLQGENFVGYVGEDWNYRQRIEGLIFDEGVDFVFEEAAGHGTTIAEKIANSNLKPGHYLDIDPPPKERPKYGIPEKTWYPNFKLSCPEQCVEAHEEREKHWLRMLQAKHFENGLVVCGMLHGLSFAFRLLASEQFGSVRLIIYPESLSTPCTRPHLD